jgi:hypothetical protein
MGRSFLSEKQWQVLQLRSQGYTQKEIAQRLGTSRENVSILEKRARENVERARETLALYESLEAIRIPVLRGTDLFSLPEEVLRQADRHGIRVLHSKTDLIGLLRRHRASHIQGNRITGDFQILLLRSGRVRL